MTTQTADTQDDEFEAAFAEAARARMGEPTDQGQASAPPQQNAAPEQSQAEGEKAGEKPEAQDARPADEQLDDITALRRKLQEAEHRERSASARVSAFHRKFNEAEQRLKDLQAQLEAAKKPPEPPSQDDQEALAALQEMPELGKAVDRLVSQRVAAAVKPLEEQVQRVGADVEPAKRAAEEAAVRRELEIVEKEFPDAQQLVKGDDFVKWIEAQPPVIQAAWSNASTGADALAFLRMFDREVRKPNAPVASAAGPKKELLRSVGIPSRPAQSPQGGMPAEDDFDGAFAFFSKQRQKAAAGFR